jgi:hypothetical protein
VAIELGTWEAIGTTKMVTAMGNGKFYTFDAGKAPVDCLGETYGVTKEYKKDGWLVDWENIKFEGWNCFGKVRDKREERIERFKATVPGVEVTFVEGLTWDTLPIWMPKIGTWDFMYQDTIHYLEFILKEWEIYEPYSKVGSLIVLDDICLNDYMYNHFINNERNWDWHHANIGNKQLWGERIF